jgi:hypothetical protein
MNTEYLEEAFRAASNLMRYLDTLDDEDLALLAAGDEAALDAIMVWARIVRNKRWHLKLMEN